MSIMESEIEIIIDRAVEKTLLMVPEVIGNLITHHVSLNKLNKEFYEKNPDLREHKVMVASVIEHTEGQNPPMDYGKLIKKALPEIRKRLEVTQGLDMQKVTPPDLNYNGEI